jgi:Sugar (and other) transporter
LLVCLRLLQGLALGGEYGGAAIYVAEHAPANRRGFYTSWIQTTATLGLFLSLLVILACRSSLGDQFEIWGWRIPFLLSILLLAISVYIRLQLQESPAFLAMKSQGKLSTAPLAEAFGRWPNVKLALGALFGATAGQAVVWYGGQFYALFFLEKVLQVESRAANLIIATALLLATPCFVIFGTLSDRLGRKSVVLTGCLLAAMTYFAVFKGLTHYADPALESAVRSNPVTVLADPADCTFQFDPIGKKSFTRSCDVAKSALAKAGVPYRTEAAPPQTIARVRIGNAADAVILSSFAGNRLDKAQFKTASESFGRELRAALATAGYPAKADMSRLNYPMVILLCTYLVVLVTMVYGPIAAWLVELFPTRIRYSAMSLPYHIGNGWFGGFLPVTSFAIVAATGDIYSGLWYPVAIAAMTVLVGVFLLPETKGSQLAH